MDAAFDHLGLKSARVSYSLLARGGSLVCYGNAALLNDASLSGRSMIWIFLKLLARVSLWNILPNSDRATFYNFWGGHLLRPAAFRRRFRQDLKKLLQLLSTGAIRPPVAAKFPLLQAGEALQLAESRTVRGKIVLAP